MSSDGKFVLGGGEKPGSGEWADFIWEVGRETRWIPVPPGFEFNEPKSVSDDGQVGGESLRPPKYAIWVWDSKEGFTIFGKEPVLSGPWCSGDGNAVAFTDTSGTYRWTLASGLRKLENLKPSGPTWPESMLNPLSTAKAISSDGSVVVGNSDPIKDLGDAIGPQTGIHPLPAMPQVCVWGLVGEPKGLGRPLESRGAYPLACSADGKSICGYDVTSNGDVETITDWWFSRWASRRIQSDEVLERVTRHRSKRPTTHGAKVRLPTIEDDGLAAEGMNL